MLIRALKGVTSRAAGRRALHSSSSLLSTGQAKPSHDYRFLASPPTVGIVQGPFSGGQPRSGVDLGPASLISAGLPSQLRSLGWKVDHASQPDFGAIPFYPDPTGRTVQPDPDSGKMKRPRLVSEVNRLMGQAVGERAGKGWLPLTLGGDHSLAIGTISGTKSKYPNACVVWVDAHADINTPLTTDSGNLHGTPVSFLLGLEGTDVEQFNWVKPCLKPEDIVYIGLRDVDGPEKKILKDLGIKCFSMHEVDKYGIGKVVEMALEAVNPGRDRPTHLSFDVDAMDPSVAPSTGTPVRGGLTFREGHYITEALSETGCLVAVDIMEVNPSLQDPQSAEMTIAVGCSLARAALGETLL